MKIVYRMMKIVYTQGKNNVVCWYNCWWTQIGAVGAPGMICYAILCFVKTRNIVVTIVNFAVMYIFYWFIGYIVGMIIGMLMVIIMGLMAAGVGWAAIKDIGRPTQIIRDEAGNKYTLWKYQSFRKYPCNTVYNERASAKNERKRSQPCLTSSISKPLPLMKMTTVS